MSTTTDDEYGRARRGGTEVAELDEDVEPEAPSHWPGRRTVTSFMSAPPLARVSRRAADAGGVSADARDSLSRAASTAGAPLPGPLRGRLETSLGADLSSVQLHTSSASAEAAKSVQASAYAVGQDIHFGAGAYNPDSAAGQSLIAHEVAHTVQQRGASADVRQDKLEVSSPGDFHEVEAESFAQSFVAGGTSKVSPVSSGSVSRAVIHRGPPDAGGAGAPAPTATPATWTVPANLVPDLYGSTQHMTTKEQVGGFLAMARLRVLQIPTTFGLTDTSKSDSIAGSIAAQQADFTGTDALTPDNVGDMTAFSMLLANAWQDLLDTIHDQLSTRLSSVQSEAGEGGGLEGIEADVAEEMHKKFNEGNEDALAKLRLVLEKINHYKEVSALFTPWLSGAVTALASAHTAEKLEHFAHGSEHIMRGINVMRAILEGGRLLQQALSHAGASGAEGDIQRFEQAIDIIDVTMTFFEAVPLVGQLWTFYYKPLTMACIKLLHKIAEADDREGRQLTLLEWMTNPRPAGATPVIPRELMSYFPGGQPVLNVMYPAVNGGGVSMNSAAEQYFLGRRDLFNAGANGQIQVQSNWHVFHPSTWGAADTSPNITEFVEANKNALWAMLYGDMPHGLN